MAITFRKLEVFLEVVAQGSFRTAADQLGISQPSVSTQIADLEDDIGFDLFHRRSGARPHLTEQAHGFVPKAREMLASYGHLSRSERDGETRKMRLVVAAGAALFDLLKPDLPALIMRHADINIEFEVVTQVHSMLQAMDQRLVDIALYTGGLPRRNRYPVEIICPISYSLYGRPDLAAAYEVGQGVDGDLPLILPPKGGWSTEPVRAMLAGAGVGMGNVVARSPFPEIMLKMALEGEAAVVMPDDAVASHVQAGSLVAIRSSIGEGHRYMLLGPNARNAQAAKVVEFLRDRVLARRRGLATSVKLPAAEEAHW